MDPQKKMVYMQRLFNPSQYRSNGMSTLNKENFGRIMIESINKAISPIQSPVKEKHVRKLLIGSYQAESGAFFWLYLPVIRLKENQIVCWKFCHVLHKMLRDGHRQVLTSSYERRQVLLDCGNMWRHVEDGYGQLIFKYCTLLYNRINFLTRNSCFPNDLKITDEQLDEIGAQDISVFFDLSCEIFDAIDDILRLQELVTMTLDLKKLHSMTAAGQCHLAPLVACIQDSSLLYDYSVKILFKLHSSLPASTLDGHRDRFLIQHRALKSFYLNASNLQYFKTLIQIPHLTDRPPNFLIASDLQQHVTPQVVMISSPETDSPDQLLRQSEDSGQLLVNFDEDLRSDELDSNVAQTSLAQISQDESLDSSCDHDQSAAELVILSEQNGALIKKLEELEASLSTLQSALEVEIANHAKTRDSLMNEISEIKKTNELELKRYKDEVANVKRELTATKKNVDRLTEECERAQHENEISQGVMKKLVKDTSDLKKENAALLRRSVDKPLPSQEVPNNDGRVMEELNKKVSELSLQLEKRDNELRKWNKEREALVSMKVNLEKQLDTRQEDLLMAEMNETDKIIKEATRRIEEMSEKSRELETGIKLQVNEKISEVCSYLMKAVRNLIIQSRLLQREIVGDGGDGGSGGDANNSEEFYKRNSSWTEGLISAANVVAMAARSLVDAADRTMSGQAKFSELAAAANEIAAATTQLVVASRVKANKDSEKLKILTSAAKQVNQCKANVVDTARVCAELIEQESVNFDISSLSLHQTKKLEMETQVRLLELEDELSKERIKLGLLRRQHYKQEDAQAASANTTTNE